MPFQRADAVFREGVEGVGIENERAAVLRKQKAGDPVNFARDAAAHAEGDALRFQQGAQERFVEGERAACGGRCRQNRLGELSDAVREQPGRHRELRIAAAAAQRRRTRKERRARIGGAARKDDRPAEAAFIGVLFAGRKERSGVFPFPKGGIRRLRKGDAYIPAHDLAAYVCTVSEQKPPFQLPDGDGEVCAGAERGGAAVAVQAAGDIRGNDLCARGIDIFYRRGGIALGRAAKARAENGVDDDVEFFFGEGGIYLPPVFFALRGAVCRKFFRKGIRRRFEAALRKQAGGAPAVSAVVAAAADGEHLFPAAGTEQFFRLFGDRRPRALHEHLRRDAEIFDGMFVRRAHLRAGQHRLHGQPSSSSAPREASASFATSAEKPRLIRWRNALT